MSNDLAIATEVTTNTVSIADLRDYAMPPDVTVLPLTPVAWLCVALGVLCVVGVGVVLWASYRRRAYRRAAAALLKLMLIERDADRSFVTECRIILKRVALVAYAREMVAGLHGDAWVEFLRQSAPGVPLSDEVARSLTCDERDAALEPEARDALVAYACAWVTSHVALSDRTGQAERGQM